MLALSTVLILNPETNMRSTIQFLISLAVATSLCQLQTSWVEHGDRVRRTLLK